MISKTVASLTAYGRGVKDGQADAYRAAAQAVCDLCAELEDFAADPSQTRSDSRWWHVNDGFCDAGPIHDLLKACK